MEPRDQEPETFGTVLRRIRQAKRLTQREVARAIGMDFSYFSRLEMGRFNSLPTRDTVAVLWTQRAMTIPLDGFDDFWTAVADAA